MRPRHLLALCLLLAACQDKQPTAPQEPTKPAEQEPVAEAKPAEAPPAEAPALDKPAAEETGAPSPDTSERGEMRSAIESGQRRVVPKLDEMFSDKAPRMQIAISDEDNVIGALAGDSGGGEGPGTGGLGLRGTGSGGGGIGLGRIGAIGSGKGSSGYGGIGTATVHKTSVRLRDGGPSDREEGEVERKGGDEFVSHGVNPMVDASKDKLSTFAVDVDTGAYTIARSYLRRGYLPLPSSVRVEEFVNYFSYNYPSPEKGAFAVSMEAAPSPFTPAPDRYLLRVGVQGKRVEAKERKPVHLTFLVDVSGSMSSQDRLPLAQQSLKILTNTLREGDSVALVTYAGNTRVVLPATDAAYKGRILAAIDDLSSGGPTAMASGIELAYKEAMASYKKGHVNRVIVLSDGDANVGNTSHNDILRQIKSYVDKGITLSTIGFGMGNYRDNLMEQLANKGNGNYYYIDTVDEARKVFGEQVSGTLEVIAKDVKIQVEFNPEQVKEYRLIGYENRDIRDRDFRNDKVDAGEIGAGHTVTAFYEVVLKGAPGAGFATVRVRHKEPEGTKASEAAFVVGAGDIRAKLAEASKDFQFGASVVAFAEILRNSPYARELKLELVEELASASSSPNQKDRMEFIELVRKAIKLQRG
jgi:Ca-activated chloride channel family protein